MKELESTHLCTILSALRHYEESLDGFDYYEAQKAKEVQEVIKIVEEMLSKKAEKGDIPW